MNYLLDTHTLIWALQDQKQLSDKVTQTLEHPDHSIFVSAITFWEIALKFSVGKLDLVNIMPDEFPLASIQTGFQLIPLLPEESASNYKLPLTHHKDPFDRMLIWQAIERNLIFISKDNRLEPYKTVGLKTLW
ncbi:type II toxin-antitoxin system VapC family toxin [Mucilaginibacter sp.]|uniref:type II toxin-antitoxin system VapC family toxin n=1 Tax=Mucilaginibacter sp. TaxID=1882438 RepID=UPI00284C9EB6|nr:type II toxin-antitoxin system VapC family toxin [Mucilaginibacter sp.]MDR3697598.1 type II toxin-antitoxin system VapC family toxin [Mucilaginibacter sp.]